MPLKAESALRKDRTQAAHATMEHRHFAFIAATIAGMPDFSPSLRTAKLSTASTFADACAGTNARFDRARFFAACGLIDPRS